MEAERGPSALLDLGAWCTPSTVGQMALLRVAQPRSEAAASTRRKLRAEEEAANATSADASLPIPHQPWI